MNPWTIRSCRALTDLGITQRLGTVLFWLQVSGHGKHKCQERGTLLFGEKMPGEEQGHISRVHLRMGHSAVQS